MFFDQALNQIDRQNQAGILLIPDAYLQTWWVEFIKQRLGQSYQVQTSMMDISEIDHWSNQLRSSELFESKSAYVFTISTKAKTIIEQLSSLNQPSKKIVFIVTSAIAVRGLSDLVKLEEPKPKDRMTWIRACLDQREIALSQDDIKRLELATRHDFQQLNQSLFQLTYVENPQTVLQDLKRQAGVFDLSKSLLLRQRNQWEKVHQWLLQVSVDQALHLYRIHYQNIRLMCQLDTKDVSAKDLKLNPWKERLLREHLPRWRHTDRLASLKLCQLIEYSHKGLYSSHSLPIHLMELFQHALTGQTSLTSKH